MRTTPRGRTVGESLALVEPYLAITEGVLLIVFGGITEHLIPLFAIGAFLTFTLSQTGMVIHWVRELKERRGDKQRRATRMHLLTNAAGRSAGISACFTRTAPNIFAPNC